MYYNLGIYSMFFFISLIFSFLINSLFLKFSKTLGLKTVDEGTTIIRWGTQTKPTFGGLSFYILFLISIVAYSTFFAYSENFLNAKFIGFATAVTIGFLVGLADDSYGTKPLLKFIGQLTCSLILIISGIYIHITSYDFINYLFTIFWVVGIMNSINMLDNIDAITTTTSIIIIIASLTLIFMYHDFNNIHVMILLGVLAALIGFLFFNWHPSKMYMGDNGTQFLGVFLASIGIIYFWNVKNVSNEVVVQSKQFIVPIMIFIVPIIDTSIVFINRILKGSSPFIGGKDHTTHHLAYWGFTEQQVVLFLNCISILSILLMIIFVKYITVWYHTITVLAIIYFLSIFGFLFAVSRTNKIKKFRFNFKRSESNYSYDALNRSS